MSDPLEGAADEAERRVASRPPITGDAVVDEATARLRYVTTIPVDEQPAIYDSVHRSLQDRLADVEG